MGGGQKVKFPIVTYLGNFISSPLFQRLWAKCLTCIPILYQKGGENIKFPKYVKIEYPTLWPSGRILVGTITMFQ